jgi:hypothetical protein
MKGRRLPDGFHYADAEPGDYWKQSLGTIDDPGYKFFWTIRDPAGDLGTLRTHQVIEHDDGTITVTPSILNVGGEGWHGFLERGVWREV